MVDEALDILSSGKKIDDFGRLLHESWQLKRSLAKSISPEFVDDIYTRAQKAGALGGKLLGAGGGGFILFFAKPEYHQAILDELDDLLYVPFEFENSGSTIIHFEEDRFSRTSMIRRDFMHLQQSDADEVEKEEELPQNARKSSLSLV